MWPFKEKSKHVLDLQPIDFYPQLTFDYQQALRNWYHAAHTSDLGRLEEEAAFQVLLDELEEDAFEFFADVLMEEIPQRILDDTLKQDFQLTLVQKLEQVFLTTPEEPTKWMRQTPLALEKVLSFYNGLIILETSELNFSAWPPDLQKQLYRVRCQLRPQYPYEPTSPTYNRKKSNTLDLARRRREELWEKLRSF